MLLQKLRQPATIIRHKLFGLIDQALFFLAQTLPVSIVRDRLSEFIQYSLLLSQQPEQTRAVLIGLRINARNSIERAIANIAPNPTARLRDPVDSRD